MKINKIFLAFAFFGFFAIAATALAVEYEPLVKIPGLTVKPGTMLTSYLSGIYNFLISIVGILAMAVIIYGGMRYLTSAGNTASMEDAKETIWSAVYGLALALGSWLLINVVNPDILVLKNPGVEGPKERYAYKEINRSCVADTFLNGVSVAPESADKKCKCVDNPDKDVIVKNRTPSKITLTSPIDGASAAVGTYVPLAGKLTDASGTPISGVTAMVYAIYSGADGAGMKVAANPSTDSNGNYLISVSSVPADCAATIKLQAYFPGNDTYAPSSTAPIAFTATGTPACAKTKFPETVKDFSGGSLCQTACSDPDVASDKKYHCLKADLRLGLAPNPEGKGTINIKVGQTVYFDARTYSRDYEYSGLKTDVSSTDPKFKNGIDRYMIDFEKPAPWTDLENKMNTVTGYSYGAADTAGCDAILNALTVGGNVLFGSVNGITYFKYNTAGKYKVRLNVYGRAPGCYGPGIDVAYVVVE